MASATTIYQFTPIDKKKQDYPLSALKGKVVLVVNTATECGLKSQFEGLEELYKSINKSHPNSFVVLGFPSNNFKQESREDDEMQKYCQVNFGVTFPLLGAIGLNGQPIERKDGKAPPEPKVDGGEALFKWLGETKPGLFGVRKMRWNFEKFLIGKDGKVKQRYSPISFPGGLKSAILAEIKASK